VIDNQLEKKLRLIQANFIEKNHKNISFSDVLNDVLQKWFQKLSRQTNDSARMTIQ